MTYKIYTLGCKVNEYESEVMGNLLEKNGYSESDNPDVYIINTCTVTNTADSKSKKMIRSARREYPNAIIVAVGCFIQNKGSLFDDLDIDIALGNKDKSKLIDILNEYKKEKVERVYDIADMEFEDMRLSNSDLTRAYIKIQDGCDNYCTYCVIPYVRGHVRCKKHEDVLDETRELVSNGHKEIVLTGIHTGNYHDGDYDFSDLIIDLDKIDGLERLRISSVEITELNDKFLDALRNCKSLVNHMHIPLQAGSDFILKKMNRKYDLEFFKTKISVLREIRPDINITTDVIVGFPGETDLMFEETINTIKEVGFSKIHVFPYSMREGTVAAKMKNQVEGKVKKERVKKLIDLSCVLEKKYMDKFIGKEMSFIPEVYKDGYLTGHTDNFILVKVLGDESGLKNTVLIKLVKNAYPYMICEKL